MMQITEIERHSCWIAFKVEGWLTFEDCTLLEAACAELLDQGKWVRLECSRVSYLDLRGAGKLVGLTQRQLDFVAGPSFIRELVLPEAA